MLLQISAKSPCLDHWLWLTRNPRPLTMSPKIPLISSAPNKCIAVVCPLPLSALLFRCSLRSFDETRCFLLNPRIRAERDRRSSSPLSMSMLRVDSVRTKAGLCDGLPRRWEMNSSSEPPSAHCIRMLLQKHSVSWPRRKRWTGGAQESWNRRPEGRELT
jgi:hypothetical protein